MQVRGMQTQPLHDSALKQDAANRHCAQAPLDLGRRVKLRAYILICQDISMIADDSLPASGPGAHFKVVLIFHLKPGQADEELRRSGEETSLPNRLARQPGFVAMQFVKLSDEQTMSIQTWKTAQNWWTALDAVKSDSQSGQAAEDRPSILVSRDFHAGPVVHELRAADRPSSGAAGSTRSPA